MKPYPGKQGKAKYCGRGAHFYDLSNPPRCRDCGHVLGGRRKQ